MRPTWQRLARSRPYRAWQRLSDARGNLLAAGIAFFAFFSLFPALALAAVVFGFVLRDRPELLSAVGEALNTQLPGFVITPDSPDGLIELKAPDRSFLGITGAIAAVTLVFAGIGWIGSQRDGIRAVFGVPGSPGNPVTNKLRDLGVLVLLGLAVLVSAVLTTLVSVAASWVSESIGWAGHPASILVGGLLVSLLVDSLIMLVLLRLLSGIELPFRVVRSGALVGALGLTVLKAFAGQLVALGTRNPLFGSIVLVVGLLFWLNLVARLVLFAAAWTADELDAVHDREQRARVARGVADGVPMTARSVPVSLLASAGGADPHDSIDRARAGIPAVGSRSSDRTTLAAGAVLGASATYAAGAVARVVGGVVGRGRRRR